jgi:hypothetical protein
VTGTVFSSFETEVELLVLEEYLDILDSQLPTLLERERELIWKDVDPDTQYAEDAALWRQHYLDDGISIRFLTAAAVVGIWAEYEATITRLAEYLRAARAPAAAPFRPRHFVVDAEKYFRETLGMYLHPPDADRTRLKALHAVRNALAHANGRLADVPPLKREVVEKIAQKECDLVIRDGYLIASRKYARAALAFVRQLLDDLTARV